MNIQLGFQLTLVLWLTIVMIRTNRHSKFNWVLRKRTLITITGWLLALVGLIFSTVYARQLKFKASFEKFLAKHCNRKIFISILFFRMNLNGTGITVEK